MCDAVAKLAKISDIANFRVLILPRLLITLFDVYKLSSEG